jgi:hypothetical protein
MFLGPRLWSPWRVFLGIAVCSMTAPALAQAPATVRYTYCQGYNPGYYGSSAAPADPGAKPGQLKLPQYPQYQSRPVLKVVKPAAGTRRGLSGSRP